MASIDKRPNGRWRARYRERPGGPQKARHFDRKVDAERFLAGVRRPAARRLVHRARRREPPLPRLRGDVAP